MTPSHSTAKTANRDQISWSDVARNGSPPPGKPGDKLRRRSSRRQPSGTLYNLREEEVPISLTEEQLKQAFQRVTYGRYERPRRKPPPGARDWEPDARDWEHVPQRVKLAMKKRKLAQEMEREKREGQAESPTLLKRLLNAAGLHTHQ